MTAASVISVSDLQRSRRLDAHFYRPEYLRLDDLYEVGEWRSIAQLTTKTQYGLSIKMNENGVGMPILRMDNLKGGFTIDDDIKYAPIDADTAQTYRLLRNDVLFNRVNSEEFVGRTGVHMLDEGEMVFASYLIRLQTSDEETAHYINAFLNSETGKKAVRRVSRRAVNQANVNASELKSLLIPMAPRSTRRLVAKSSLKAWQYLDLARQAFRLAHRQLADAIGITPESLDSSATFGARLSAVAKSGRLDAESHHPRLRQIRELVAASGSGATRLTDYGRLRKEKSVPEPDTTHAYIELGDINQHLGLIVEARISRGSDLPTRARRRVDAGTVVASSVAGSLAKVAQVPTDLDGAYASTGFFAWDAANGTRPELLLALLTSQVVQDQMTGLSSGTILQAVSADSIGQVVVPILEPAVQDSIAEKITATRTNYDLATRSFQKATGAIDEYVDALNASLAS